MARRASAWAVCGVVCTIACVRDDGSIGVSASRLVSTDDVQTIVPVTSVTSYGPQAAYVPPVSFIGGIQLNESVVVSFEQTKWTGSPSDVIAPGWAVLSCPNANLNCPSGPTYTHTCSFDVLPGACNGGTAVPTITHHRHWLGRSSVIAEGKPRSDGSRNVVIATLVDTDSNVDSAEQIALVVSNDGGQSFTHTIVASLGGDGCDSGRQDFPSLAFDETTNPPQGFLVWRNRQHESFGGCVQSFFIDDTGTPQRIGLSHTIGGMDKSHGGSNEGQGFLKVVAADHAVTVVYASDASIDNHICGTPLDHVPTDMGWGAVTSFDDGANWSEKGNTFLSTNSFLWCSQKGISRLQRGLKEFDAALGPDGNLFVVAVVDDTHMRLVMSPMRGVLAHGAGTKNDLSWREWCPLAAPPFASRWRTTIGCTSFEFQGDSIMRPTLSFDTNGRLLISYYHKSTMNPAQMQFFVKTITAPRAAFDGISDFQPEQAIGNPFEMFGGVFGLGYGPNDPLLQKTGGQPDIDSANSLGWQNAIVAAGALFPFPQGPRPFFVFYTEGLSSDGLGFVDNVAVQSARVDFSPAP